MTTAEALTLLPYEKTALPQHATTEAPLLLEVFEGKTLKRPPVWMMRQAGRYMHEYQAVRQHYSFLEICKTPEVAVEVTLQPLRAFGFDASIIFSDILIPLEAMGLDLSFTDSHGPAFANPLRSQVNQQVEEWARDILNLAEKDYQAGNLEQAIAKARQIPNNMAVAAIIEERIANWQGTWTEGNDILSKLEEVLRRLRDADLKVNADNRHSVHLKNA